MPSPRPLFVSSGDLVADRRYQLAQSYRHDGDLAAAVDLLAQACELAPTWAAAWFALGEAHLATNDGPAARSAFEQALRADPADALGARLHLARLDEAGDDDAMSDNYVAGLFDQYADAFEAALVGKLGYRGPALIVAAVETACARLNRPPHFKRGLDLGCGTGLMGAALHRRVESLVGIDLSAKMLRLAQAKNVYRELRRADMLEALRAEPDAAADLVLAADAFVYVRDLAPLIIEAARVLGAGGLLAFTAERLDEGDVELGPSLRYRHSIAHVTRAAEAAGLAVTSLTTLSARNESGAPVPGLVAALAKPRPTR